MASTAKNKRAPAQPKQNVSETSSDASDLLAYYKQRIGVARSQVQSNLLDVN